LETAASLHKFKVSQLDSGTRARTGTWRIGDKRLETPVLWLGYRLGSSPKPWEFLDIDSIIVNAHEMLSDKARLKNIEDEGIHSYLGFNGAIVIDSGGFLFLRRANLSIDVTRLMEVYERSRPMIGVVLDYPFDPFASRIENESRWARTLENTRAMLGGNGSIPLMPVIHGYTLSDIARACDAIEELSEVDMIGMGSIVPLMKGINGQIDFSETNDSKPSRTERQDRVDSPKYSSRHFVVDAVKFVRKRFPDAMLHVFGVGGTTTMHLMLALGVDSLDSIGWRIKAGHGAIQLPGTGDRFLSPRDHRRVQRRLLDDGEKTILSQCECPICIGRELPDRIRTLDRSFENRALHNAWTYLEELRQFKQCLQHKSLYQFLDSRMRRGALRQLYPLVLRDIKESPPAKAIRGPNHAQE
jgi:queuine/archaeosine tRNA-ribosyltransferase